MIPLSRHEQKEKTRHNLIETSRKLFAKEGISATTTANIAKTLRISHGTVFLHFPVREDLIFAVIDDFGRALSGELKANLEKEFGIKGILTAHIKVLTEFEDFYYRLLTEMHSLPEMVKGTIFMLNAAVSNKLYIAAEPLMRCGEIKKMERPLLFNTWMSLLHYYIVNREHLGRKPPILKEKGSYLLKHFLELIYIK
ncbi:transcriptional regulator, TetR family [Leptospira fainei serovar Hurstbridge str. BUT 6]|uniref:Transcriptional regulator, TetR family n=1 Tax=Leptospira fainei serovar Hurstbridge str. BUT 6 TaxID=1193011 RepID=S3UYZ1_9LEPT|nr:TetR/AcrR family transcriptional regulator [Leptospira fainei]EPG75641.1 transcriptional regulator, TetR family [Leptospira fainei serovar Hurstbridge str. BUT 6]